MVPDTPLQSLWSDDDIKFLLAYTADVLWKLDAGFCFTHVASAEQVIWGHDRDEIVGMHLSRVMTPESMQQVGEITRKRMEAQTRGEDIGTIWAQIQALKKDGTRFWAEVISTPMRDEEGKIAGYTGITRDVTARKLMEDRLAESEANLRSLIDASPMGIHRYRLEPGGRLIFVGANPAADRILGVDNAHFIGRTIEDAFPPLKDTIIPETYKKIAATGEQWTDEQVNYSDGLIKGAYQVFGFQTSPNNMAVIFLDITPRKVAEAEKRRLEADLLQAQKMEAIGRLAGGVAHDFNNLLTAILGYCDLAQIRHKGPETPPVELDSIRMAAEKAASLTHQLLAFSRKQILQPKIINPADIVTDAQKMLGRLLGEHIQLNVRLAGDTGYVLADPGQMTQVIMNLALNARDAMPSGGTLLIETRNAIIPKGSKLLGATGKPGPHVIVKVSDTGHGIDESTKARIFEPFFTTKEAGKGTGLGLATVHGIVTQSGGTIIVDSTVGQGTEFTISLPLVEAPETAEPVQPTRPARGGGERILIAEDSADVRELALGMLEALGYTVIAADTGEEALAITNSTPIPFDLLLTDVVMPGMSGRQLADALTKTNPALAVVYMSGYTEDAIVRHGILEDGLTFIQKPFTPAKLAEAVRRKLDARE